MSEDFLAALTAGTRRVAEPDASQPDGWRVDPEARSGILALFADRTVEEWLLGPFRYRDRIGLPTHPLDDPTVRVVPGGTSVRAGAHLESDVVIMPPSFINIGAWIGAGTMVDSGVLVGSCAQIGRNVHLAAGVVIGGVLEPAGARPVIVEDEAFIGAGVSLLDGVMIRASAVIGAGVTLTGTSRLFDLVHSAELGGTSGRPLVVPERAVVVPGVRSLPGAFALEHGLSVGTALIVKYRDAGTDARVALEAALR